MSNPSDKQSQAKPLVPIAGVEDALETIAWCRFQASEIMGLADVILQAAPNASVASSMMRSTASDVEVNLAMLTDRLARQDTPHPHSENNHDH